MCIEFGQMSFLCSLGLTPSHFLRYLKSSDFYSFLVPSVFLLY